jgi:hypothetical protein
VWQVLDSIHSLGFAQRCGAAGTCGPPVQQRRWAVIDIHSILLPSGFSVEDECRVDTSVLQSDPSGEQRFSKSASENRLTVSK